MLATKMFNESPLLLNDKEEGIRMLTKASRVLFGVKPENVDPDLYRSAFNAICERFIGITTLDMSTAFSCAEIEKKQYVSLSRDELIGPVKDYWSKKIQVRNEIESIGKREQEEIDIKERARKFKEESIALYIECMDTGEWTGTEYHANTFAQESFGSKFTQDEKDVIWNDAKAEFYQKREAVRNNDPYALPPPPAEKIFSRMIVEAALKRKMFISID